MRFKSVLVGAFGAARVLHCGMAGVFDEAVTAWFAEVDLDPEAPWLRMGTRQLGERPWLLIDSLRAEELALKRQLCAQRHGEVFAAEPSALAPGEEVLSLVSQHLSDAGIDDGNVTETETEADAETGRAGGVTALDDPALHPLDAAGRAVQEDLCLLRREESGWILAAASLCFPSRWRLADKMGRPLADVHGPVAGYRSELASRVDSLFDRLGERVVWRRNWFIHPDASLFQPDRPPQGDPVVPPEHCLSGLVVRSERQTLRTLPDSGWILFTIRIQQATLGQFLDDPDRRRDFGVFLNGVDEDHATHRGLAPEQLSALHRAVAES